MNALYREQHPEEAKQNIHRIQYCKWTSRLQRSLVSWSHGSHVCSEEHWSCCLSRWYYFRLCPPWRGELPVPLKPGRDLFFGIHTYEWITSAICETPGTVNVKAVQSKEALPFPSLSYCPHLYEEI